MPCVSHPNAIEAIVAFLMELFTEAGRVFGVRDRLIGDLAQLALAVLALWICRDLPEDTVRAVE